MKYANRARRLRTESALRARRALAWLLILLLGTGCNGQLADLLVPQSPEAQAGVRDFQHPLLVAVPGGLANAAGGNLFLRPGGLSLETALGPEEVGPVYNSASAEWRFGFLDMTYDGVAFVDQTGASHAVGALADGATIPGTVWVRVDGATIRSKGGLVFEFGEQGELSARRRMGQLCPRIVYERIDDAPTGRIEIRQEDCGSRGEWSTYHTDLFVVDLDSRGRIERVTDRAGHVALYAWSDDDLVAARDGLDVDRGWPGTRFEYGPVSGRPVRVTNSEGEQVAYEWYAPTLLGTPRLERAMKLGQAGEADLAHRFDYYPESIDGVAETVVTDPAGEQRRYAFDAARRVQTIAYEAVGEVERFEYEGEVPWPSAVVLASGARESYLRNADGDIVSLTQPSGNVLVYTYADANNRFPFRTALESVRDDLGAIASFAYTQDDPVDYKRLASATNGAGEVTRYDWHAGAGFTRLASITFPDGVVRSFEGYGPLGQATQVIHGELVGNLVFDAVGNLVRGDGSGAPEIGGVIERRYDADRNPAEVTVASSAGEEQVIRIERGSDGRVLAIDRPPAGLGVGPDHRFGYDSLGRLAFREERVDGAWQATVFEYDARGELFAESLPNGMRREWVRDQRGRLVLQRALRDGVLEGEVRFTYAGGHLVAVDDSERGRDTYTYDAAGRRSSVRFAGGETLEIAYDARSRIVRETFRGPDAALVREIEREYDGADREVRVFDGGELVIERTHRDGRVECVATGNGLERCFTYDPVLGQRDGARTTNASGQVIETTTVVQSLTSVPGRWEIQATTDVPGLGSVASAFEIGPASDPTLPGSQVGKRLLAWHGSAGEMREFAYDAFSNFVDDSDGDAFAYNAEGNRLLAATVAGVSVAYDYDAAGYAIARDGVAIEWTASGRMSAFGPYAIEWDMQGRPLRASDASSGTPEVRDWSRWGGRIELDGDDRLVALDLGEVVLGFGGERRYRHFDFRDNVAFVSDESGAIVTLYEYAPYGISVAVGDAGDGVRFVGRSGVGPFLWLGERMLDPLVGRFLSPDPVFHLLNQYTYTLGNPVWFTDPTGREPAATSPTADYVAVGVAVVGYGLAVASLFTTASPIGFFIAAAGVPVAALGLALALTHFVSTGASSSGGTGCSCVKSVKFGSGNTPAASGSPAGAAPSGAAPDSGSLDVETGGLDGAAIGGVGAGVGIPVSCGLTGIEFALFVAFALARRRRRNVR